MGQTRIPTFTMNMKTGINFYEVVVPYKKRVRLLYTNLIFTASVFKKGPRLQRRLVLELVGFAYPMAFT